MSSGAANYNPDDFDRLRPVEDTHFWFVSRNNILAAAWLRLPRRSRRQEPCSKSAAARATPSG